MLSSSVQDANIYYVDLVIRDDTTNMDLGASPIIFWMGIEDAG